MKKVKTQPLLKNRIIATAVDYLIFLSAQVLYTYLAGMPDGDGSYTVTGWLVFPIILAWFIYFPITESINGQTLGHKLVGSKVVKMNGNEADFGNILVRRLFDPIDIFIFFGVIGLLAIYYSENHQRLGDIVAKTVVVGGESVNCKVCKEKLTLDPQETVKAKYTCPYCGSTSNLS